MERLKSLLADKILDLSSGTGDEVKAKVEKIQRFRDFANACKTLMIKYPAIEDELVDMVNSGDYDTKVASSRVDSVIRLADAETIQADRGTSQIVTTDDKESLEIPYTNSDEIPLEILQGRDVEEETVYRPEDVEYEEMQTSPEEEVEQGYVPFESIAPNATHEIEKNYETIAQDKESDEDIEAAKRKATIRKVIQVLGIALALVVLIFVIIFIKNNLKEVLITIGIIAALAIAFFWFKRKRS